MCLIPAFLLLRAPVLQAQPIGSSGNGFEFRTGMSIRVDALQWSIAGANSIPNILSELTWWNLVSPNASFSIRVRSGRIRGEVSADIGPIVSGLNTDYDYNGNNRSNELMHSDNSAGGGLLADVRLGAGYSTVLRSALGTMRVDLLAGPYFSMQNLVVKDGIQYEPGKAPYSLPGLTATYNARWIGPWIGVADEIALPGQRFLTGRLDLNYAFYLATADWIKRSDFLHPVSFQHWAQGGGLRAELGIQVPLTKGTWLAVRCWASIFTTAPGTDRLYTPSGSFESLLNGATWQSYGIAMALSARQTRRN
jgi:hypothetical protein